MRNRLAFYWTFAAFGLSAVPSIAQAQANNGAYIPPAYVPPSGAITLPPQPNAPAAATPNLEFDRAAAAWIDECVRNYKPDEHDGKSNVIGGAIGAVVGGVAGNRIAGNGSRLGGTLLGAGVGGIAGTVIGSAIDRKNREKAEDQATSWCKDYLARNTSSPPSQAGYTSGTPYPTGAYPYPMAGFPTAQYAMAYPYGPPMMMQPVMIPVQRCHEKEVVEKIVYRTTPARRVIYDKRVKTVPVKTVKTIKTVKTVK